MERASQKTTTTNKMAGILLLSLLNSTAMLHAQHKFQSNSTPPPSRPAPSASRPAQSESHAQPRESRPAPVESRPAPAESRPEPQVHNTYTPPRESQPTAAPSRPSPAPASNYGMHSGGSTPAETRPSAPTHSYTPPAGGSAPVHSAAPSGYSAHGGTTTTVSRGAGNMPVAETRHADGTRVVTVGRSHGYVEHPIAARPGFVARTYVAGGRPSVAVYRQFAFHGAVYYRFMPAVYYRPAFYMWALNPWVAPVYFGWGWSAPWYGYYGVYFAPAPYYTTPSLWLTDYLLAENLKAAYEAQLESGAATAPVQSLPLSPEIKRAIAAEVQSQIAAEQQAAQQSAAVPEAALDPAPAYGEPTPPALDPTQRVFVVSSSLQMPSGCALTPGDILLRTSDTIGPDGTVAVSVLASKPGSCPINGTGVLDVAVLQEMHNQFRQQIDTGLGLLSANQGTHGLPAGPYGEPRPATQGWASVDADAQSTLQIQQQNQ